LLKQLQVIVMLDKGAMFGRINIDPRAAADRSGWQSFLLPVKDLRPTSDASGLARRVILTGDREANFSLGQIALVVETNRLTASIRRRSDAPGTLLQEITVAPGRSTPLVVDIESGTSDIDIEWNFDADNSGSYPAAGAGGPGAMPGAASPPGATMPPGVPPGMMGQMPPDIMERMRQSMMGGQAPASGGVPGGAGGAVGMPMNAGPRIDARSFSATPDWPNELQNYRVEVTVKDRSGRKEPVKTSLLVKVRS
jgi:hypothetical protein